MAIDGWFMPEKPLEIYKAGRQNKVSYILSANSGEIGTAPVTPEITVEFYDESGTPLGKSVGTFKDIAPGEVRLFDVRAERLPNMSEIESHKILGVRAVA